MYLSPERGATWRESKYKAYKPGRKQEAEAKNYNGGKDGKVKRVIHERNHLGWSPAEFMLSQLWIGSHVRPLKSSTPNTAISFLSAAVYQCHSGSTMQNPFWLFAPLLQERRPPPLQPLLSARARRFVKGELLLCSRLIYLFVTHGSIRLFCCKNELPSK